ncbi:hypothetical protein BDB00DRAFT_465818 [Zychaea mexicana]|uniref:uncharacterized protein n=1 Tax=Zychaea mexicana TaxID=64656 RepID=UPI0022FEB67C|nr:uncharacterized protein BDB00DRAFT_465818 [Zychaea mexicana]KAI9492011.1 hypothetical protein BDB00DRAFT_465818 [Zychaea mexicana]
MTNNNRPSPRRSRSTVAPFTVKRKQVNYEALDMNSSQCSLASLLCKNNDSNNNNNNDSSSSNNNNSSRPPEDFTRTLIENKAAAERNARVQQLEKELKQATHDQQTWRHKCRLLESEREKFQATVTDQCEKDKELLQMEIKILKEAHLNKVQEMASAMAQLQRTVALLREQLSKHGLAEGRCLPIGCAG